MSFVHAVGVAAPAVRGAYYLPVPATGTVAGVDADARQRRRLALRVPDLEEPVEPAQRTSWGYRTPASAGVAFTDSEIDMRAAKVLAEAGTPLVASVRLRLPSVAHQPWMVLGMLLLVAGAVVYGFTGLRWVWPVGLVAGLIAAFAPVAVLVRRARNRAVQMEAGDRVLVAFDKTRNGPDSLRHVGMVVLRQYATGALTPALAHDAMLLVAECEEVASRIHAGGRAADVDDIFAATSRYEDLSRLFVRLLEIEDHARPGKGWS